MASQRPFKSCDEALDYLYHFTDYERMAKPRDRATSVFGLARMNQLLEFLGNPHQKLKAIHIAGTKGKGSTAAMVASILRRAGASVEGERMIQPDDLFKTVRWLLSLSASVCVKEVVLETPSSIV